MRLRKTEVSFSIKLTTGLNSEPQNIEPQNHEGWNRCALSFELIIIDRIPSFDIRYSVFDIRHSLFNLV